MSEQSNRTKLLRYCVLVAVVVLLFAAISWHLLGTSMHAIGSGSMEPNMHAGDLVFTGSVPRTGIVTYQEGAISGYETFGDFGNVVLYRKYGRNDETPIIHRAMYFVEAGEPMWDGGPAAPHAGYITKGDNNPSCDQRGICREPVRDEWIAGVACLRVPYVGNGHLIFSKIAGFPF